MGTLHRRGAQRPWRFATVCAIAAIVPSASAQPETATPAVRIAAQVDRTTLEVGGQLALTLTISAEGGSAPLTGRGGGEGDLSSFELKPVEFPTSFQVFAQRRSSNISMQHGQINKSISLTYVLVPLEPGTFRLGPFQLTAPEGQTVRTDPIDIVVNKPVLPPALKPSQRFIL